MWFDPAPIETFQDAVPEWTAFVFAFGSYLGSVWFVAPTIVLAYLFADRHRFGVWIPTVIGGYAIMVGLKGYFGIPRPDVGPEIAPEALPTVIALLYAPAVEISTSSFPSGHAIAAVMIWTAIALESEWGTARQRFGIAGGMIVAVSVSRVGAGVHYPIDVIVGTAIGIGYLGTLLALRRTLGSERDETSIVFGVSALLAALAFAVSGNPDAIALLGGSIGGLVGWHLTPPPRQPWSVWNGVLLGGSVGIGLLGAVAVVLTITTATIAWFAVGLLGGFGTIALPWLVAERTPSGPTTSLLGN